jgi:hypothetical protein
MRGERIVFPSHFLNGFVHFAHGVAERHEAILQAVCAHVFV